MEKRLKLWYDKEGDILEISAGEPQEAISEEIGDDVVLHRNFKKEIVGFTILNFRRRFEKMGREDLPISVEFFALSKT
ncbi:MAG TPA: DUF2283 domain-containing protein [Methanophagales archaeon]|jgi:uncharacterized protein YuzE|nr:putative protein YuzE [Methanophagales archaeon]HID20630.1 DUF2283 domain-containing protein [Methanophagales archaeon]